MLHAVADERAGQGAGEGANVFLEFVQGACREEAEKVNFFLNFVAELTERVYESDGVWPDVGKVAGPALPRPPRLQLVPEASEAHVPARRRGGGWECQRCGKRSTTAQALRDERCVGHAAARLHVQLAGARVTSHGHHLWRTAGVVWCCRCGRNVERHLVKLRERCPGRPAQPWKLANLKAGSAPKARATDPPLGRPVPLT
ncbi:unnamed protein product [Prorocentrum cordatum]|uniref:Ubiquitinyl hydrolase 1 n=1 Tax=Prorocentrum cordatum TaxID=2364126 RepID=A0ABN9V2J2_9DINO|nr:unnamed protein product [Polarella glacialis]